MNTFSECALPNQGRVVPEGPVVQQVADRVEVLAGCRDILDLLQADGGWDESGGG